MGAGPRLEARFLLLAALWSAATPVCARSQDAGRPDAARPRGSERLPARTATVPSSAVTEASSPGSSNAPSATLVPRAQLGVVEWFGTPGPPAKKQQWQREKNPTVAMLSSLLLPGLGQLYNEREFWALVVAGVHFGFAADIVVQQRLTLRYNALKNIPVDPEDDRAVAKQQEYEVLYLIHRDNRIQSTWLLGLTVFLSAIQSYVDAHLFDFDADAPLQLGPTYGRVTGGALRLHF